MQHTIAIALLVTIVIALAAPCAMAQHTRILFLHKSEGFEHSPISMKDGQTYAGKILAKLAADMKATFMETKDASLLSKDGLKNYDLVILYTQGDITKPSKDGGACAGPNGQAEFVEWVKNGGKVMGFHAASDTFHTPEGGEVTPFIKMIGGEFKGHGPQFKGTVKVVDPKHPAMANVPQDWRLMEEWYSFKNFNTETMRVLALLDAGENRAKDMNLYGGPAYPIIWCSAYGQGKVFFNGLGHREDVWDNPLFQKSIVDAINWLMDPKSDPANTKPNYNEVVPKE